MQNLFHERISSIAQAYPDKLALSDGVNNYSYSQLNKKIMQIACGLTKAGVNINDGVIIYMQRSLDYIICQLAILYIGAYFIPVNTAFPEQRINLIVGNSHAGFAVFDHSTEKTFDVSIGMIYCSILAGKSLFLIKDHLKANPRELTLFLKKNKIDLIDLTPTYLRFMCIESDDFAPKFLFSVGEALSVNLLEDFFKKYGPEKILIDMYGPTEACIFATSKKYDHNNAFGLSRVSIGRALKGYEVIILDDEFKPAREGQIFIAGRAIAQGYVGRPDLTAESFVKIPDREGIFYASGDYGFLTDDGEIEYLGRKDDQLKINGYRVETKDIESNILKYPGIDDVHIKVTSDLVNDRIVAYLVSKEEIDIKALHSFLLKQLPIYMIPNYFMQVDRFYYNINGKFDEAKLPDYELPICTEISNNQSAEETIVNIIESTLLHKINLQETFLFQGGNSLDAFTISLRLQREAGIDLPPNLFLSNNPLADIISNYSLTLADEREAGASISGHMVQPPSFQEMTLNLERNAQGLEGFEDVYPQYNLIKLVRIKPNIERSKLELNLRNLIAKHQVFRLSFLPQGLGKYIYVENKNEPFESYYKYIKTDETLNRDFVAKLVKNFRIDSCPLINFYFIETVESTYLLINAHHALFDYYSFVVMLEKLLSADSSSCLQELEPVEDYLEFLAKRRIEEAMQAGFWKSD
ncbi:MAG: non-ribosomal peptide synthetase [Eubacteriales bacterium]|nr:non-ribosomal peptide synthetase [Eubacteriales bacterium]